MFTGIIQAIGKIDKITPTGEDVRLSVNTADLGMADVNIGDSIAVNGVCLTAVTLNDQGFSADVSQETLNLTTLAQLKPGTAVNLEKALTLSTPLGGHLVSGHVDGMGEILQRFPDGEGIRFTIRAPDDLARYIAPKGSICVNGISLTVNNVSKAEFQLMIVPHTLVKTTLSDVGPGDKVNLEVDLIARYLERMIMSANQAPEGGITLEMLAKSGFASD